MKTPDLESLLASLTPDQRSMVDAFMAAPRVAEVPSGERIKLLTLEERGCMKATADHASNVGCPGRVRRTHCQCWWDAGKAPTCCACGAVCQGVVATEGVTA